MALSKIMASKSLPQDEPTIQRKEPGCSWSRTEEHVLPKNRLGIVGFALVCTMFLAALDQVSQTSLAWGGSDGETARLSSQLRSPPS